MARSHYENVFLHVIAKEALNFLLRYVDLTKIRCILLTGSVANGEGTVIQYNSSIIASDFDIVIYLDFPYFLKNITSFLNLSKEMSKRLVKRGVNTHIGFLPSTNILGAVFGTLNPDIYEYEFAFASKCIFGKNPTFNNTIRPTKRDALELTFTVISDLVFKRFNNISKTEESYIWAKRSLTLLNSLLIFIGVSVETYKKRIKVAKEYTSEQIIPVTKNEIKTLEIFTEYKLSGSIQNLMDTLGFQNLDDLVNFQFEFLKKLTTKILYYELMNLVGKQIELNLLNDNSLEKIKNELPNLLKNYSINTRTRLHFRIIGILLYFFGLISRNKDRSELFATCIFYKQSPKVILNMIVALLFIHEHDDSVMNFCKNIFSWINFDSVSAIHKIFSLWQASEQSIKLN